MCGSLVTVRNETLQVVHLTVKQYIKSPPGPTRLRLLAETKSANLQLTLACLSFLKHKCAEPIAKLFLKRPVGAEEDVLDLSLLRCEKPFLEYACFSWLVHLTNCTNREALEVSGALRRTFDSPSTFGWVESCMALQSGSESRLLLGLEDVRNWIHGLQLDGVPAGDLSLSFASNWCRTMEQVLEEYGRVISQRPAMIYYLDLALNFAAHELTDTYEKYGDIMRREKCSRFHTDRISRPAQKKVPPYRQLPKSSETGGGSLGFFLYEPNRDIYIFSNLLIEYGQPILFAQSASSGRRLPPVSDPEIPPYRDDYLLVWSFAISGDGRYLGIVFRNVFTAPFRLIMIWEIEVTLDFTRRMQASPWARKIHVSAVDEPSIAQLWSKNCIAFDHDGVCFTPSGLVRTASEANSFVPDNPLLRLPKIKYGSSDIQRAFYSENGKFLFVSSGVTISKYSLPDLGFRSWLSRLDVVSYMQASPSGRYLIAETLSGTLLEDTLRFGNMKYLSYSGTSVQRGRDYAHHFSVDEREVVAFYANEPSRTDDPLEHRVCHVYYYTGLPNEVHLQASGKRLFRVPNPLSTRLYVSSDHRTMNIVTESGEIQRIRLGDEIVFMDTPDEPIEYPFRSVFLSQDGSRWATVYYGNDKAQMHIHTVLNPNETPRCIELQRTSSLSADSSTVVTTSMDLSILVLDGEIYRLRDSNIEEISVTLQILKLPKELRVDQLRVDQSTRLPQCLVDPSNSYVAYHTSKRYRKDAMRPDVFALFRISPNETSSPRLQPCLPKDMFNTSSQFHPSIPLLIVGFRLISEAGALQSDINHSLLHVVIIDMKTMSKRAVEIEQIPNFFRLETIPNQRNPSRLTLMQIWAEQ